MFCYQLGIVEIQSIININSSADNNSVDEVITRNRFVTRKHSSIAAAMQSLAADYLTLAVQILIAPIDLDSSDEDIISHFSIAASKCCDGPIFHGDFIDDTPETASVHDDPVAPTPGKRLGSGGPGLANISSIDERESMQTVIDTYPNENFDALQLNKSIEKLFQMNELKPNMSEDKRHDIECNFGEVMKNINSNIDKATEDEAESNKWKYAGFSNLFHRLAIVGKKFLYSGNKADEDLVKETKSIKEQLADENVKIPALKNELKVAQNTASNILARIDLNTQKQFSIRPTLIFPASVSKVDPQMSTTLALASAEKLSPSNPVLPSWDRRTQGIVSTKLDRSPRLAFRNEYMAANWSPPQWGGPPSGISFRDFFIDTYEPYIASRIRDDIKATIPAIFYSFKRSSDRERYRNEFLNRDIEIIGDESSTLNQLIHMISLRLDLRNVRTQNQMAKLFNKADKQYEDEDMVTFIERIVHQMAQWKGVDWYKGERNRQKVIKKIIEATTAPTWTRRFGNSEKFELFNSDEPSPNYDHFRSLIDYYTQFDCSRLWNANGVRIDDDEGSGGIRMVKSSKPAEPLDLMDTVIELMNPYSIFIAQRKANQKDINKEVNKLVYSKLTEQDGKSEATIREILNNVKEISSNSYQDQNSCRSINEVGSLRMIKDTTTGLWHTQPLMV